MPIKHRKESNLPDGANPNLVQPSDWNDDHEIEGTITVPDGYIIQDGSAQPETFGPEHHLEGRNGKWIHGIDVANDLKSRDYVSAAVAGDYAFDDGATTSGSPTLTSPSQGGFASVLVGAALSGSGIPAGTTVTAVTDANTLTMSANATATASGVRVTVTQDRVGDIIYLKHRGARGPTVGIGMTPPDGPYRLQIAADDAEPPMGNVGLRVGATQTGHPVAITDSSGWSALRRWIDKDFDVSGSGDEGLLVYGDTTNERSVVLADSTKTTLYGFTHPTGGGGIMRIRYINGGADILEFQTSGGLRHISSTLGFYAAPAVTKPEVTGAKGGNAALTSLLSALSTLGLITDSTT